MLYLYAEIKLEIENIEDISNTYNQCDESLSQNDHLDEHKHSGIRVKPKPYTCTDCGKSYGQKGHFKEHKRKHTGIPTKPYTCTDCEKSYGQKGH